MLNVLDEVLDRVSIFKDIYDVVRVVDPIEKSVLYSFGINCDKEKCYSFLKKETPCNNCICERTYTENNTFAKIEYKDKKIFFVTSISEVIYGKTYIVELLKDISSRKHLDEIKDINQYKIESLINKLNSKVIQYELTE